MANIQIEDYRRLVNFITIYHGQLAIEKFKKQKMQQYKKMLQNMATRSINNAYLSATLNSGILKIFEEAQWDSKKHKMDEESINYSNLLEYIVTSWNK